MPQTETVFNQSIWGDEGFSAILSMKPLPEIIKIIATDTSPPLWNITEWAVFNTLGTAEIYIRALAFLYFLGAVFFTYKIGSHLWSRKTGAIAAILTFFNPFFFIYAFEGRMYSILAVGVTASMYFFLKRRWKLYAVATLWAMYSHHFAIFALFIQGVWFVYEFLLGSRKRAKKMFRAFIVIGILYLPWVIPLYNQITKVGGGFWLGTPDLHDLKNLIYEYLAQGIKSHPFEVPVVNLKLHEISLYMVFATLLIKKWWKSVRKNVFLLTWFLGPIVLTWGVSQVLQSIFFNRYLLYAIPAAMLVVAANRKKISYAPLAILLVTFVIIDFHYFTHPAKLPFRQMSEYVKSTRVEGDFLVNWNSSSHHIWETKYYGIDAPIYIPGGGELPFFVGTALMEDRDVISSLPDTNRVGVITSGELDEITMPEDFVEKERRSMNGLKFVWYVRMGKE